MAVWGDKSVWYDLVVATSSKDNWSADRAAASVRLRSTAPAPLTFSLMTGKQMVTAAVADMAPRYGTATVPAPLTVTESFNICVASHN